MLSPLILRRSMMPLKTKMRSFGSSKNKMPKLTYFGLYGKAESIRMALWYSGTKYENEIISAEQWAELKPKTEWGFLPMFENEDGVKLG